PEAILDAAETVAAILKEFQVDTVIIGALALAAHHYVRFTEDIDLGINTDIKTLRQIADALREKNLQVELREPDADDPLSGVIDVTGSFGMVQIINFGQTFPAVIFDAIRCATLTVRRDSNLRLAPLPHLVALKLYAGRLKSKADIAELLARNLDADLDEIRNVCDSYRLQGLEEILDEM
ncbi:MAG: hypothetical protein ACKVHP_15745, partial [Verrucomicrobiales bacterium]